MNCDIVALSSATFDVFLFDIVIQFIGPKHVFFNKYSLVSHKPESVPMMYEIATLKTIMLINIIHIIYARAKINILILIT